ncbi:hypothetical protein ABZ446_44540 [Streptomyces sp. NPDC005813]|uniref:hypothetical protein n=1 Tax=Streptomyces sp. NPDC005813 TaxID=3155592 RepID=UPI0033C898CB
MHRSPRPRAQRQPRRIRTAVAGLLPGHTDIKADAPTLELPAVLDLPVEVAASKGKPNTDYTINEAGRARTQDRTAGKRP